MAPQADDYLEDAAEQWSETDTVHFLLDVTGPAYLDESENVRLESAEGDLERPDSARVDATLSVNVFETEASLIIVEDDAYLTNFFTGDWERAPESFGFNLARLFDDRDGLGAALSDIEDPELVGTEQVDGRQSRHIRGTVSSDQASGPLAGSLSGDNVATDVWLAEDNNELLRLRFAETEGPEDERVTWDFRFSDHNEDVEIERPDL